MTVAYVEPFSGISGDMTVGALLDLGLSLDELRGVLRGLDLGGYRLEAERTTRGPFVGTRFLVEVEERQPHRGLRDVLEILEKASIPEGVRERSIGAFDLLAEAEARAHGTTKEEIHFHEVGAVDSIIDIVGAAAGLEHFGVERILCSRVRLGTGEVDCRHGRIPVPAPAALELLRGFPVLMAEGEGETTTPTGAAILAAWGEPARTTSAILPLRTGYGAGARTDTSLPNLLRVTLAEAPGKGAEEEVIEISANVDDLTPETLAFAVERLMGEGALDAWVTPVVMKKGRPGHLVSALAHAGDVSRLEGVFFRETTTFGVRRVRHVRTVLERRHETVETVFGVIRVKVGTREGEVITVSPEYEDCAALAAEKGVPIREVFAAALRGVSR